MLSVLILTHSTLAPSGLTDVAEFCKAWQSEKVIISMERADVLRMHCSGDHTVKIICHRTGQCLKVLTGHRRTPWVVRFHPTQPHIVASGSLDYEVRHLVDVLGQSKQQML